MPSAQVPNPKAIRLGHETEIDLNAYELRRRGRSLRLERVPMEILLLLVERNGELVSREQICERIWGNGAFLDTNNNINGAIRKIRLALRDDPRNPRFIVTVPGKGYRFPAAAILSQPIPHDREIPADSDAEVRSSEISLDPRPESAVESGPLGSRNRRHRLTQAAGMIHVLIGGGRNSSSPRSMLPRFNSRVLLAVLPFRSLSGTSDQDCLREGLNEEMITQLGSLDPQRIGVIARNSVMPYVGNPVPPHRIGSELGVHFVLEGSVQLEEGRVRIAAQLIRVSDQSYIWARAFHRQRQDILTLQSEIAREITGDIQRTLFAKPGDLSSLVPPPARNFDDAAANKLLESR